MFVFAYCFFYYHNHSEMSGFLQVCGFSFQLSVCHCVLTIAPAWCCV